MSCSYTPVPDANLNVVGPPGGVTSGHVAVFDGTSGNVIADGGALTAGMTQLTGDVTAGPGSGSQPATIANDAVTNAKLANMAQATIKGRASGAGTGDPTDLSGTQATVILDTMIGDTGTGGTKGLVPAPGSGDAAAGKFLKADGTFAVPSGTGTGTVTTTGSPASGNLTKFSGSTSITNADLTGDVTTSGTVAATIANSAVTLAKIANASANSKLLGSGAAGSGAPYAELTLGTNLTMSGTTLNASAGSGGDVVGPSSAVDVRIAVFDGTTGKLIKDGGETIASVIALATGGAGRVKLAQIVTSGSQATVDFTSISGSYSALSIEWIAQNAGGGSSDVVMYLKVNNDGTSGNYTSGGFSGILNGSAFNTNFAALTQGGPIATLSQSGTTASASGGEIIIPGYAQTTFHKRLVSRYGEDTTTAGVLTASASFRWKSTSAIKQLTFGVSDGTNFSNGSIFTLYGSL